MEQRIFLVFLTLIGVFTTNFAVVGSVEICDDEVACSFIQQSNVDACSNTSLRVYCNKTCGLCPTAKPCVDEPACVFIMQGNANACSNPSLKVYCNLTCGICSTVPPVTVTPVPGPTCYDCVIPLNDPTQCQNKKTCDADESCGVVKLTNGLYEVKCISNQSCQAPGPDVTCSSCCSSDLCNRNCRLPSECLDNNLCPALASAMPNLCAQPDLAIQCNGTCLKQKNETCTGIPGSSTTAAIVTSTVQPLTSSLTTSVSSHVTSPGNTGPACTDSSDCTIIQQTSQNFCSDVDLMFMCNQTCGLCSLMSTGKVDTNPCLSQPCVHGQCHTHSNTSSQPYTCTCDLGYLGARCDQADPCYKQPCAHGQCTVDSVGGYQCQCDPGFTGPNCDHRLIRDCQDVLDNHVPSQSTDNIYDLDLSQMIVRSRRLNVMCEFASGHGWTVLMNRESGQLNFDDKLSTEYALGFGNIRDEFWIGLEYMHAMTSDGRRYQLRIDMTVADGSHYFEIYNDFSVGPHNKFELHVGSHYGTAGDSLSGHGSFAFTTKDRDQDSNPDRNCAEYISGGWWFHNCGDSCLTCNYLIPGTKECKSMSWGTLGYCTALRAASMKLRPM